MIHNQGARRAKTDEAKQESNTFDTVCVSEKIAQALFLTIIGN